MNSVAPPWPKLLPALAAFAVIIGVIARFKGLGYAPFAVDEYYLAQSISGVLRTGLPGFQCGGFYTRGLLLQYLAAGLQLAGLSGELAPRLISVVSSLAALPAAYLLGRRLHGRTVGYLIVALLALSVWEVEMARFGRMYAPFQAVFLWYLVYFLRYTVDRESRALWPMLVLSIAGPFVWEGGIFLLLANLLPPLLQHPETPVTPRQWPLLAGSLGLLGLAYGFLTFDFRGINSRSLPETFTAALTHPLVDPLSTLRAPLLQLPHHPAWLLVAAIAAAAFIMALGWIYSQRTRPLLALGLLGALLATGAHQFLAAGCILLLLPLMRYIACSELFGRPARRYWMALLAAALFWVIFGAATLNWHDPQVGGRLRALAMLGYQFLKFPDFIGVVLRPWVAAIPHLGAALLLLCSIAVFRMVRSSEPLTSERTLLVVLVVLLLAASASHPPRQETRYVFNLYPLAMMIALGTISRAAERIASAPSTVAGLTTALAIGGFALTEDFRPHHLQYIDSAEETFRIGMRPATQSHLVIRDDYRALARWLQANVPASAPVINGVHGLDRYYSGIRYFYVDESSPNFPDWSCRQGTVERWGNYPLLYSVDSLATAIGTSSKAYLVSFGYERDALLRSLASLHPRVATSEGAIIIIELRG